MHRCSIRQHRDWNYHLWIPFVPIEPTTVHDRDITQSTKSLLLRFRLSELPGLGHRIRKRRNRS
jgi:hypothetical protein